VLDQDELIVHVVNDKEGAADFRYVISCVVPITTEQLDWKVWIEFSSEFWY